MNAQYLQIGSRVLNVDNISSIDLAFPRPQGGTQVRIWFLSPVHLGISVTSTDAPPRHLDLTGNEAQAVRKHFRQLADTGGLLLISEETETTATTAAPPPKTKAAGGR